MCLEQVYAGVALREKLRSGPLGWLIDGFCRWLFQRGAARRIVQVAAFLDYLETDRGCKASARNQRLAALRLTCAGHRRRYALQIIEIHDMLTT